MTVKAEPRHLRAATRIKARAQDLLVLLAHSRNDRQATVADAHETIMRFGLDPLALGPIPESLFDGEHWQERGFGRWELVE